MTNTTVYSSLRDQWHDQRFERLKAFAYHQASYLDGLLPDHAMDLDGNLVLLTLSNRLGIQRIQEALNPHVQIASPLAGTSDTAWLKRVNMVGINVRTIGSFWNVVKYALTLPPAQSSIHLLPIWEPGVVASLYGIASWNINPEFFSQELYRLVPELNTIEKQLKVVVNLLHAMGKTVGMDVIPHTDRYSEIVLANPSYFEWLQRKELAIVDHREDLHEEVQSAILGWLSEQGPAAAGLSFPADQSFFRSDFPEQQRLAVLFGFRHQYGERLQRRASLIDHLYHLGLEPVPATMAPPYRSLEVDPNPEAVHIDKEGRSWHDYQITEPQEMSRVFGPLTRFKFYGRKDDNQNWEIDFDRPRPEVWDYFCRQYADIKRAYNFDFMRGDMSHVQMRPEGVPATPPPYYDPHRSVKEYVRQGCPYFAYFAESFLTPPDFMAYGDEVDHLEASLADSTLGDLQSMVVGGPEFMQAFHDYLKILEERSVAPNFTIMTGDKDDPRFDKFYLGGNEARLFIGLFLTDMPSYMALGFEQRDPHPSPAPNEQYTKLYVFHLDEGPKATEGPYQWGRNGELFSRLERIRQFAEQTLPLIQEQDTRWLLPVDPSGKRKVIAWTQDTTPQYLFVVNLNTRTESGETRMKVPKQLFGLQAQALFSTHESTLAEAPASKASSWTIPSLQAGEGRCFILTKPSS